MAILRKGNKGRYTVIPQSITTDTRLSLRDLGLLVKLLSLPDDWEFSEKGVHKIISNDGMRSIRAGLNKLETLGYLRRERRRDEKGRLTSVEWYVFETPVKETKVDETRMDSDFYPNLRFPILDNRILDNRILDNHIEGKIGEKVTEKFVPPSVDEVKKYCSERGNLVSPEEFVNFYESKNWMIGKNKMKKWKAAVITWELREKRGHSPSLDIEPNYDLEAYGNGDLDEEYLDKVISEWGGEKYDVNSFT